MIFHVVENQETVFRSRCPSEAYGERVNAPPSDTPTPALARAEIAQIAG
jgi:hypothetical protein